MFPLKIRGRSLDVILISTKFNFQQHRADPIKRFYNESEDFSMQKRIIKLPRTIGYCFFLIFVEPQFIFDYF